MKRTKQGVIGAHPLTRSELMSRVRGKDSAAERSLRSALHAEGLRFRPHRRIAGIAVDIVFPRPTVAVFVDGCFWHGCPEHETFPKTNQDYWLPKLKENKERDIRQTAQLRAAGWRVFRVWEHECIPPDRRVVARIVRACRRVSVTERVRSRYRGGEAPNNRLQRTVRFAARH